MDIRTNYSLKAHNTFGMDVTADCYIEYETRPDLLQIVKMANRGDIPRPLLHIGGGSNLLFTKDFHGTVLRSRIMGIDRIDNGSTLKVGAGVVWEDLCDFCAKEGIWGIENLSIIPGEVGGAVAQNIGAYGVEIKDVVQSVEAFSLLTGEKRIFSNAECRFGYRDSIFKTEFSDWAIVTATLALSYNPNPNIEYGELRKVIARYHHRKDPQTVDIRYVTQMDIREAIIEIRSSKLPDPAELGSAGSFFKNPIVSESTYERIAAAHPDAPRYPQPDGSIKLSAAWLIDKCGWKGVSLKGARCYEKQPLVIVNSGNATASDIMELAKDIQESVRNEFGVDLKPEVKYI